MMFKIELHPEVIKFFENTGTVWRDGNNEESFVVNNSWYRKTETPGVYTVQFLTQQPIE